MFLVTVGLGTIAAVANGLTHPSMTLIFGQMINSFSGAVQSGVVKAVSKLQWIRGKIGLVSQEPIFFATTIRENIAYGKDNATNEEIRAAIEMANAAKFIDKLPDELDTMVGEHGTQLSDCFNDTGLICTGERIDRLTENERHEGLS
ncbi:hypothetical protein GOBAR_DD25565 [Gossypium barbadense]|nr:hypothetical protein GOBAR_DD25565 [Gossypium barbadense]